MKYLGKGKITNECSNRFLETSQIVDVFQYEEKDEIDSLGICFQENIGYPEFRIFDGKFYYDCYIDEIELT